LQALKVEAEKAKDRIEELEAQAKTNQSNFDKVRGMGLLGLLVLLGLPPGALLKRVG